MPQNIFGTDGVRGVANADLSCDLAFRLGRAATKFLGPDICIGRDTRLSGTMLESALTAGIMAEGGRPHCCGVIPTPAALQRLGATVHAINTDYCGTDINVECGSTHLEPLRELVLRTHADIGLAHDGDADRVLFVDSEGNEIDGDYILAICGSDLAARGKLANSEIVSTVMCNLGFSIAMKEQGFEMVQTAVGDRYVLERMLEDGAVIGGEQSGHIIFLEHNTTGDGLVTALQLLAVLKRTGRTLTDLAGIMKKYPQVLVNVHSDNKAGLDDCQPIWDAVAAAEKELNGRGRILVRPSGTEPLVRVMAEAETHELTQRVVDDIVEVVKRELP